MAIDPISVKAFSAATQKIGLKTYADEADPGARTASSSFTDSLKQLIDSVETSDAQANTAVNDMLTGQGDVHQAMIALQRADMMLQLTVQVRNKLVSAYQDIMRMPM